MSIVFLPDQIKIGNYTLRETTGGLIFDGTIEVRSTTTFNKPFQGSNAGFTADIYAPIVPTNQIDKFPFASESTSTFVGDMSGAGVSRYDTSGQSSETSGYVSGGRIFPTWSDRIDKFPFAASYTQTFVGSLSQARSVSGSNSDKWSGSGYVTGGRWANGSNSASIDKFSFSTDGNGSSVGSLTTSRGAVSGQSSNEHGYGSGGAIGHPGSQLVNTIDKFPFSTGSSASSIGILSAQREWSSGQSSSTSGYVSAGMNTFVQTVNTIDKFPFATDANAANVAALYFARSTAGISSTTNGYATGGNLSPGVTNAIHRFPFSSNANSVDVGDLRIAKTGSGTQY